MGFSNAALFLNPTQVKSHAEVILSRNPVGYWRMDEVSGTTAVDSSGHNYNGIYNSPAIINQPPLINAGRSMLVTNTSGNNPPVEIFSNVGPLYLNTGAWGIEGWFKTSTTDGRLIGKEQSGATYPSWWILLAGGAVNARINAANNSTTNVSLLTPATVSDNNRHSFHFRMNGSRYDLFLDGVLVAGQNSTAYPWINGAAIAIGGTYTGGSYSAQVTAGGYDEYVIYGSALTDAQILENHTSGL